MKKYEKIRIVQGVTIDCYCTEAPDAFFDRRYKCLLRRLFEERRFGTDSF